MSNNIATLPLIVEALDPDLHITDDKWTETIRDSRQYWYRRGLFHGTITLLGDTNTVGAIEIRYRNPDDYRIFYLPVNPFRRSLEAAKDDVISFIDRHRDGWEPPSEYEKALNRVVMWLPKNEQRARKEHHRTASPAQLLEEFDQRYNTIMSRTAR